MLELSVMTLAVLVIAALAGCASWLTGSPFHYVFPLLTVAIFYGAGCLYSARRGKRK